MQLVLSLVMFLLTFATGCGVTLAIAEREFSTQYDCHSNVKAQGSRGRVTVSGCGKTARYRCINTPVVPGSQATRRECIQEGDTWIADGSDGGPLALSFADPPRAVFELSSDLRGETASVRFQIETVVTNEPSTCPMHLLLDGRDVGTWEATRVGDSAPPRYATNFPLEVGDAIAAATRVVGSLCSERWQLPESRVVEVRRFVARVHEELALRAPSLAAPGADVSPSVQGAPTSSESPAATSAPQ